MKTVAIIVAGGSGKRMGGEIPKQYLPLQGIPLLAHTLAAFQVSTAVDDIFLVVPAGDFHYVQQIIVAKHGLSKVIRILAGGEQRQDSVRNGLDAVGSDHETVVIHDGARPLVSQDLICQAVLTAREEKAVACGLPARDTVKTVNAEGWVGETISRDSLWLTQTPQAFEREIIKRAYQAAYKDHFYGTDDASLVERMGIKVRMIPGSSDNIKITTRDDILWGEFILERRGVKG